MTSSAPTITLTTDFGTTDPYAGIMRAVILRINPTANVIDITHEVRPHDVTHAAFLTECSWPYAAQDAIHLVVVDPGVGTEREAIVVDHGGRYYVGPDNGSLSAALPEAGRPETAGRVALPEGCRAFAITNERYMLHPVSTTFHGRDVFAAAAAHLSLGLPVAELGNQVEDIYGLPAFRAHTAPDGGLRGRVIHIDRFGNLITDVRRDQIGETEPSLEMCGRAIAGPVDTYAGYNSLIAIFGSSGYLEIALPNASAEAELGASFGTELIVRGAGLTAASCR
jgi:S-adenosylmethionine hydrolase